jgi:hypothetical protein
MPTGGCFGGTAGLRRRKAEVDRDLFFADARPLRGGLATSRAAAFKDPLPK